MSLLRSFLISLSSREVVAVLLLLAVFALPVAGLASSPLFLTEGEAKMVELSGRDLNCIKTSVSGVSAGTSSKSLDVSIKQDNIFVSFKEGETAPQEILIMTPSGGVFTLILVPKSIPSQTVILRLPGKYLSKDEEDYEPQSGYVDKLKEIIKSMYHDTAPEGFSVKKENRNILKWAEVSMTMTYSYDGASIIGETYIAYNQTKNAIRLLPNDFYEKGVLAVSVDTNDLAPKEATKVYVLKKRDDQGAIKAKVSSPLELPEFVK